MLLDLGGKPEHHAQCYAADGYLGSVLTQYVTGYGIPLCHGCPLWDTRALRIRCRWWRASFHFIFVLLLVNKHLQVFHFSLSCAVLLCRGLLCALHFPRYFFCVYLYVFLQCSGFRLPTPTSPTSVRGGCVCVSFSVGFLCLA